MGQSAEQYEEAQRLGSVEMFVSEYGDTNFTSLGVGEGFGYSENITPLDGSPDNGVKPRALKGISNQSADVNGTLWTVNLELIAKIRGEIDTYTVSAETGEKTLATGGFSAQKEVIIKAVNKTEAFATAKDVLDWVTTPSAPTVSFVEGDKIIRVLTTTFYKCNFAAGEAITYTSDKDGNPIMKYPFSMKAEEDDTIAGGTANLFKRVETVELPA